MSPFQTERFLRDIKHVDKDLRLMALFDLRRFLPSAEEKSLPNEVVEKTLTCLSSEERCEEVQNEAANILPALVVKCQQRETILQRLLTTVARAPPSNECEEVNLHYLRGMAFRKCCAEFAEEARRNILFWQKQLYVARALCKGCAAELASDDLDEATREVIYTAVNALISAYRDALDDRTSLITRAVRDFQSATSIRHASLMLVESLIVSVEATTQQSVLHESTALLLGARTDEHYVAYLQLCETELRALRMPPQPVVQKVFDSVCGRLRHAAEQYGGVEDSSEILLEVFDSLIQWSKGDSSSNWQTSFAAVKNFISFDPYYTGSDTEQVASCNAGYDDEYDEYYDYNNEMSDSTWKLRVRAVRILQTLIAQYDDMKLGIEALTITAGALRDRVELVQLEGIKVIRAAARRTYVRDASCLALLTIRCQELCGLLERGEEKVLTAVTKALEEVFEVFADSRSLTEAIMPLLLAQVRANATLFASNPGAVEGIRSIVENVVNAASGQPCCSAIVELSTQLPVLCVSGAHSEAAAAAITRVSKALARVYAATHASLVPAALGREYGALVGNAAVPGGCRVAAMESLARWIATCGFELFERPATVLWAALDSDVLRRSALRALHTIASSDVSAAAVPAAVLQSVESLLTSSQPPNVRVAATEVLLGRLSVKSATQLDAALLQRLTQLYIPGRPLSLASCEVSEMRSFALLLRQLFQHIRNGGGTAPFYTPYVAPIWDHLTQLVSAAEFSRNLLEAAVEGVTALLTTMYARDTSARMVIERDLAGFLTRDQAHLTCSYTLVRCISADAVNTFLESLSTRISGNVHFLLCIGEVGKENALDARWCALLLDSVTSKQGEAIRTSGEVALSYSMLYPANASTILIPCSRRAADGSAAGRYYFVKAVKEAATLAWSRCATAFHKPAVCEALLTIFLGAAAGSDLEELYGACVGVLSAFLADAGTAPRIASLLLSEDTSLETRVTCMVALRHFLSALMERGASVEGYRDAVVQALLQLRRPASPKESTAPSLPLRSMALRLLTAVLQHRPQWLLCEETRNIIFPNLLAELREDGTLQGTIDLSGYTHRVDKGLECRKLAFESLSTVFWAERQHGIDITAFCNAKSAVMDALIVACSAHNKGDHDSFINDTAKELLLRFVEINPDYVFTSDQLDALIDKLARDIMSGASPTDAQKSTLLFTVKCVMRLSSIPAFAYHAGFWEVAEVARTSGLLAQSLKM